MLEVGKVLRPHGLRGEVVVDLVSNRPERARPGAVFQVGVTTLRASEIRPFGKRWLVRFDGVADLHGAETLRGAVLQATALDDGDALWVHELIGAQVVRSSDGVLLGQVKAVVSNPASDLLELEDGTLVPVRFVVASAGGRVEVDPPAGLIEG